MMPLIADLVRQTFAVDPVAAGRLATADQLVADLCCHADLDHDAVTAAFLTLPVNIMPLLDSRDGVSLMASALAEMAGSNHKFEPTSH